MVRRPAVPATYYAIDEFGDVIKWWNALKPPTIQELAGPSTPNAELHDVDVSLTHLALAGVFDQIAALVVGRPVAVAERWRESDEQMSDLVLRNTADFDFPVLYDVDLGHTPEKVTLPVGALARVDPGRSGLAVVEPSVRPAASR